MLTTKVLFRLVGESGGHPLYTVSPRSQPELHETLFQNTKQPIKPSKQASRQKTISYRCKYS